MKKLTKYISLFLACAMLLTLVACGPAGGAASDLSSDAASAPEQSDDLSVPSTDGTGDLSDVDPSSTSSSVEANPKENRTGPLGVFREH